MMKAQYDTSFPPQEYVGKFISIPPGLPDRFYPEDKTMMHQTDQYVLCFKKDFPLEKKAAFIKLYNDWYQKNYGITQ